MQCKACGGSTKEFLAHGSVPRKFLFVDNPKWLTTPFCHEHLLREFESQFTAFPHKMVVFYPDLEDRHGSYTYGYLPIREVRLRKLGAPFVETALRSIVGNCQKCGTPAQAAYFGKGVVPWNVEGPWHRPDIEGVHAKPELLCRPCAWLAVKPSLYAFAEFRDGLCQPYESEGLLLSLQV
jgi:hypothetical protein